MEFQPRNLQRYAESVSQTAKNALRYGSFAGRVLLGSLAALYPSTVHSQEVGRYLSATYGPESGLRVEMYFAPAGEYNGRELPDHVQLAVDGSEVDSDGQRISSTITNLDTSQTYLMAEGQERNGVYTTDVAQPIDGKNSQLVVECGVPYKVAVNRVTIQPDGSEQSSEIIGYNVGMICPRLADQP